MRVSDSTLGAAPSSSTQLGYSIAIPSSPTFSISIGTGSTTYCYSPGVGSSAYLLSAGTYTMSMYCFTFFNGTITACSVTVELGVISSATTTPSSTTALFNTRIAPQLNSSAMGTTTNSYFPTYTFTVTTSNYYYAMCGISACSITGGGTISTGCQMIGLVRIA